MKTLGDHLRQVRKVRKITIKDLSEKTKIKKSFLSAIEKGHWNKLPEFPIVVGFVKSISNALDINTESLVKLLKRDYPPKELKVNPNPEIKKEFRFGPRLAFLSGVVLIVLAILGYLAFQYSQFIKPPKLKVNTPTEDQIVFENVLVVSGETEPNVSIIVNDQPAFVDEEGNFYTELDVTGNLEIVDIVAKSRSGQETKQVINVKIDK